MRDHKSLRAFQKAKELVNGVYSTSFVVEERFGIQSQVRRAAVSVVANIVEGAHRSTEREYARFIEIAAASAAEVECLLEIAKDNDLISSTTGNPGIDDLIDGYNHATRMLHNLHDKVMDRIEHDK